MTLDPHDEEMVERMAAAAYHAHTPRPRNKAWYIITNKRQDAWRASIRAALLVEQARLHEEAR